MAFLSECSVCFQLIVVLSLGCLFLARVDAGTVNQSEDARLLLSFRDSNYEASFGGYWTSWNATDENPCGWIGVICTENYTISELDFSGWGLQISALDPLYNLTDLRRLDLSSNSVSPRIPDAVGSFTGLIRINLSGNNLKGAVPPSISTCLNLRYLSLEQNEINALPAGMSNLVHLQVLSLAGNNFTGPFPTGVLGNLISLVSLDLSNNAFEGSIPSLPYLTNLVELKLDNNSFTGFDEPWFLGAKSLQHLSVSNNQLNGSIPSNTANLLSLRTFNVSGNKLSGNIPLGFFQRNMSFPFTLDFSQNQLSGGIPNDFLETSGVDAGCHSVNLSYNLLTGSLPVDAYQDFCFSVLDLSHNHLSGPILSNIFKQDTAIHFFWLNDNHLFGDIVDVLLMPSLGMTQELRMQNNLFTGDLSRLANTSMATVLGNLSAMDLRNNHLQWRTSQAIPDPVKATLEVLTSLAGNWLSELWLGGNNFSGTSLPTACFINNSTGSSPALLDLSNSQLEGEIFGDVFDNICLPSIKLLNLSNNNATGPLPKNILAHQQPFIVDVSNNDLFGQLPNIPSSSNLYNPKYFAGNGLCGGPLPPCPENLPRSGPAVQWWLFLIIIGGSMTMAVGSCLVATWRWRVYHKRHQQDADLIRTLLERDSATLMSLRELKKATNNFAEGAQIGEGGFGTVYVGKLNDGTTVAIKRSKREGNQKDKEQFLNEVRILSQVNHRHLVKLLGCCMENKIALLVFEFVSNGTLQEHLQGKIGGHLSWKQRLNIAAQTADALNYLHSAATSPIFHRDVKSANILLNEALDAKVADFGISKLAPLQATHVSTIAVQGTMGYIDPEYYTSYQLTDKSDVYSFGVVLLELISAKPPIDFQRGEDETSLVNLAGPHIEKGALENLIDPVLLETYSDPAGHRRESILNFGRLATQCLNMQSKGRPSMNEVLKQLQNFALQYNGTSKRLHSINEDDNVDDDHIVDEDDSVDNDVSEEVQRSDIFLLPRSFSGESSGSSVEMSRVSSISKFYRSLSMR